VILPNSIADIPSKAFKGCVSLAEIRLPSALKKIGGSAFEGCISIERIVIPPAVADIGGDAFNGCSLLMTVECKSGKPAKISGSSFSKDTYKLGMLMVRNRLAYEQDKKWAKFVNIQEF
jgi:hypothetical protein